MERVSVAEAKLLEPFELLEIPGVQAGHDRNSVPACGSEWGRLPGDPPGDSAPCLAALLGGPRKQRLRRAHRLLGRTDLVELARASREELEAAYGLGASEAGRISAAFALVAPLAAHGLRAGLRAHDAGRSSSLRLGMTSARRVFAFLQPRLRGLEQEVFLALLLDGKHRLFRVATVSVGTLTSSLVHPREVFRTAIRSAAAAVLVAHNHPSGDPEPSAEDLEVTRRLREVGGIVGIPLLDHVIVGENSFVSLRDQGWGASPVSDAGRRRSADQKPRS